MSYRSFKAAVLKAAGWQCEVIGCDAAPDSVHHLVKVSLYPTLREDLRVGMAVCGPCHSEIERRERTGELVVDMIPTGRLRSAAEALREELGRRGSS